MAPLILRWIGLLGLAAALLLQSVGSAVFEGDQGARSLASFIWLVGPALGWIVGPWMALRHPSRRFSLGMEYIWIIVLALHAVRAGILGGVGEALVCFLSWGAWFGVYLWLSAATPSRTWLRTAICGVFVLIGVTLSVGVIFEAATGVTLIKETTVGEDLVRRYGLSQSVVVGGIQTGCGLIAGIYLSLLMRSTLARLILTVLAAVQWMGLFLCAARAPILLSLVAVLLVLIIAAVRKISSLQFQAVLLGLMALAAVPVVLRQGWLNEGIIEYLRSSLTVGDSSNQVRIERMQDTIREATRDTSSVMLGIGAGESVVLAKYRGFETMTSESSGLKLLLETGMTGVTLFYGILGIVLLRGLRCQAALPVARLESREIAMQHLCLLVIVLMLAIQTLFHDMLTTWVISGVYWTALGILEGANAEATERLSVLASEQPRSQIPRARFGAPNRAPGVGLLRGSAAR